MSKRCLLHLVGSVTIALAAVIGPSTADAGPIIYVAGAGNEFGTLDLTTGDFTQIGTLSLSSGNTIFGMGFGADGNLYGLDSTQPGANLYRINTGNANASLVGTIQQSAIDASVDAVGTMYALSRGTDAVFYTLNPPSTATAIAGPTGITSNGLVAVNASGTQVFAGSLNPDTGATDLYSINPTTGVATLVGSTGFRIIDGLFVGGTLYGFDFASHAIVAINMTTGTGTQVATYSLPNGDFINSSAVVTPRIAVPEPSSLILGLMAVIAGGSIGLLRRRRGPTA